MKYLTKKFIKNPDGLAEKIEYSELIRYANSNPDNINWEKMLIYIDMPDYLIQNNLERFPNKLELYNRQGIIVGDELAKEISINRNELVEEILEKINTNSKLTECDVLFILKNNIKIRGNIYTYLFKNYLPILERLCPHIDISDLCININNDNKDIIINYLLKHKSIISLFNNLIKYNKSDEIKHEFVKNNINDIKRDLKSEYDWLFTTPETIIDIIVNSFDDSDWNYLSRFNKIPIDFADHDKYYSKLNWDFVKQNRYISREFKDYYNIPREETNPMVNLYREFIRTPEDRKLALKVLLNREKYY